MDFIWSALGEILVAFYQYVSPFVLTIAAYALAIRAIFIVLFTHYFRNIKLEPIIQPEMEKVRNKFKNQPDRYRQELPALLISKGYSFLGSIIHFITNGLFALGLGFVLMEHEKYLTTTTLTTMTTGPIPVLLFQVPLNISPAEIMFSGEFQSKFFLYAATFLLAATGLHMLVDRYMSSKSLLDTKKPDAVMLLLLTLGCFVLPLGVSIFWIVVKLLDIIHILLVEKFYKVNLDRLSKMKMPVRKK
jgi:membrane protein insertase Oxa1/YidC/SpoIIIJ